LPVGSLTIKLKYLIGTIYGMELFLLFSEPERKGEEIYCDIVA
jgi:hypothetical protein